MHIAFKAVLAGACLLLTSCTGAQREPQGWIRFVQVDGQPEPVPAEWVATPEGEFAHSIKIPNPVPKDSGYRPGMSSREYFEHLCREEAGEFIFKTVANVEGFHFMRPPRRPTDDDLLARFKLEAPEIERTFQLRRALPEERARIFINPPWSNFSFVEELSGQPGSYIRMSGYRQGASPMSKASVDKRESRYGLTWRGIRRALDREHAIAGSEWIVLDLQNGEVLAVQRDYALTGHTRNARDGIWWLNAINCQETQSRTIHSNRFYEFLTKSLQPAHGEKR